MELIQETKNDKKNEGGVTLRDIVELVFDNWYWIVLSVVICMSVAWFYLAMQTPLYKRSAVMLVKSENKSGNDMSAVLELNGGISGSGVENEIYILQSHQLMREVVGRLHLDVTYQEQREVGGGDIAYVQVEAVLAQSDLYNAEGIALKDKTEKAQKSWAQKEQNFQYEVAQLQEKYQKGLITTNDAQSTQENIERRIASYQAAAQKEAKALDEENFVFSNRAQDLLHRAIENLNADGRYKLIVNANALLDADSTLDITPAVLQEVNRLYALEKKDKDKK